MQRRMPRSRDLSQLLHFKPPELNATKRRLAAALTIEDLRSIAKRRTPKVAFDYADGAAETEVSLARARQAFRDIEFHPRVLRDVSNIDTSVEVLGGRSEFPFGIAPTGFTRLMHSHGELAGATAAGSAGIPFALSTLGTASIEEVAAANPNGRNWFQLYIWRDRERTRALIERAAKAGFDTLLVTVDVPVAGARLRDRRNGMTIPPTLKPRTVLDAFRGRAGGSISSRLNLSPSPHLSGGPARWASCSTACSIQASPMTTSCGSKSNGPGSSLSKASRRWTTRNASRWSASTESCFQTMVVGSSTGLPCRSGCSRVSYARSAGTLRSIWTPAS